MLEHRALDLQAHLSLTSLLTIRPAGPHPSARKALDEALEVPGLIRFTQNRHFFAPTARTVTEAAPRPPKSSPRPGPRPEPGPGRAFFVFFRFYILLFNDFHDYILLLFNDLYLYIVIYFLCYNTFRWK